ncbi:MAG: Gfo/Idh/MocA family protein, partial [Marmoricola sp.]
MVHLRSRRGPRLAFNVEDAQAIADAADEAGVQTMVMLRNRFSPGGRRFLSRVANASAYGAQASFVSGAALEGARFATPWRVARGALLDLGPHLLDLLEAALGLVVEVSATGDPLHWLAITTTHEGGAIGQSALSITTPRGSGELVCRVATDDGEVVFDAATAGDDAEVVSAVASEFARSVRSGRPCSQTCTRGCTCSNCWRG